MDTPLPGPTTENRSYVKPSDRYYELCDGDCDCRSVPCAEYVYDHRNGSMLTQWLVDTYVGGTFLRVEVHALERFILFNTVRLARNT